MYVRQRWNRREKSVICCWQREQVEGNGPLICFRPPDLLVPIQPRRKCKTNLIRLSGLPMDPEGPIYTDPLPPNVRSSEQKCMTDLSVCSFGI